MNTYVLIPGAWLGGWAWRDVAQALRSDGSGVYPVTLPALAERAGEASPHIDIESYVTDVVELLTTEDLNEVTLVAHSFGGAVAGGVADRIPERLARVVYVDTGPMPNGSSYLDLLAPAQQQFINDLIATRGEGWLVPMPSWEEIETELGASLEGLGDEERAVMRNRATPQPAGTWTVPLKRESSEEAARNPKILITCSFPLAQISELIDAGHPWFAELAGPEWSFAELPTGHWPMFSRPADLAGLLAHIE